MTLFPIIIAAVVAFVLGYFLGRSSRNSFIVDMKRAIQEEKGRSAGIVEEYKSDRTKVDRLNERYEVLLKEKNTITDELKKAKDEHTKETRAISELESEKRDLQAELKEVHEVWGEKVDAARRERDDILRTRDEEAVDWTRKMEEQRTAVDEVASNLKEKNARIDELNALLLDNQKKVGRHDAKHKKEIEKLKSEIRQKRKSGSKSGEQKKADAPKKKAPTPKVKPEVKVGATEKVELDIATSNGAKDDLTKIEGIGPKISEILVGQGITSFSKLAESKPEAIKALLEDSGPAFKNHAPDTWPKQAAMASGGQWAELKKWQDELDGGKD